MRHLVTAQRRGTGQDALGQPMQTWVGLATVRASIEPLMGKEYDQASGEHSRVSTRIRMRWQSELSDLKPADRILFENRAYDIQSVINVNERNRELLVMCNVAD